jgi:hypothetical protein
MTHVDQLFLLNSFNFSIKQVKLIDFIYIITVVVIFLINEMVTPHFNRLFKF